MGNTMIKAFDLQYFGSQREEKVVMLPSEFEKAKQDAFEKGKQDGIAIGKEEGRAEGEKAANEANQRLNMEILGKMQNSLQENFGRLRNDFVDGLNVLEGEFLNILHQIVDQYFKEIGRVDFSDSICEKVEELLHDTKILGKITIEVNPEVKIHIEQFINEKFPENNGTIEVKANENFSMYDVKIFNDHGFFERSISDLKERFNKFFVTNEEDVC